LPSSADTVVADAGPLIALARVDCIRQLPAPFRSVLTTPVVVAEVSASDEHVEGRQLRAAVDAGAIRVQLIQPKGDVRGLGAGEASVIQLARVLGCGVLMDDRAGRRVAARLSVPVIGVLGTLVLAKRAGQIKRVRPLAEQLIATGYYLGGPVIDEACRLAGE
jgi:predicted nucleic acid-binding protein